MQARKRQKANPSQFKPGSSSSSTTVAGQSARTHTIRRRADSDESSADDDNRGRTTTRQKHKRKRTALSVSPVRSLGTPSPPPAEAIDNIEESADVRLQPPSAAEYQYYTELTRTIQWERQVDSLGDLIKLLAIQYYSSNGLLSPPEKPKSSPNRSNSIPHLDDVRGEDVVHPNSILYRAPSKPSASPIDDTEDGPAASDADEFIPDTDEDGDDTDISAAAATSPSPSKRTTDARRTSSSKRTDSTVYMAKAFDQSALDVICIYFEELIESIMGNIH